MYGDEYTGLEQLVGGQYQLVGRGGYGGYGHGSYGADPMGPQPMPMGPPMMGPPPPMGVLPYGGTPQMVPEYPQNVRQYPLGFYLPNVPPASTVIVVARPQIIFRPRRLVVPLGPHNNPIADNFSILDIRVGKNSQFVSAEELPASIFQERSIEVAMGLDTANIGQDISITVRNLDNCSAHDFRAVMLGASLE